MADSSPSAAAGNSIVETSLLLCACIEEWQAETSEVGDRGLDWDAITAKMVLRTGKPVQKADLRTVWKYIAYGRHWIAGEQPVESISYSDDEEPFHQPFSAVKRHKAHITKIMQRQEAIKKGIPAAPINTRHILQSTLPDDMRVEVVNKRVKMTLPEHLTSGSFGIQPPTYVPVNELAKSSMASRPIRQPRVAQLAVQGNESFTRALKPTYTTPASRPVLSGVGAHTTATLPYTGVKAPQPSVTALKTGVQASNNSSTTVSSSSANSTAVAAGSSNSSTRPTAAVTAGISALQATTAAPRPHPPAPAHVPRVTAAELTGKRTATAMYASSARAPHQKALFVSQQPVATAVPTAVPLSAALRAPVYAGGMQHAYVQAGLNAAIAAGLGPQYAQHFHPQPGHTPAVSLSSNQPTLASPPQAQAPASPHISNSAGSGGTGDQRSQLNN